MCSSWVDYRLRPLAQIPVNINGTAYVRFSAFVFDRLWLPRLIFRNAISAEQLTGLLDHRYVKVWPNAQRLEYCAQWLVNFEHYYELSNFPFDEQYCEMDVQTLDNQNRMRVRVSVDKLISPSDLDNEMTNVQFRVRNNYARLQCPPNRWDPFGVMFNETEQTLSCGRAVIRIVRRCSYYIMRYHCLAFLYVCMSFISFWITLNAIPGRVILTAVVLLNLISLSQTAYNEVSAYYMTSMYWWMWGCQFLNYCSITVTGWSCAWYYYAWDKVDYRAEGRPSLDGYYFGKGTWYRSCGHFWDRFIYFFYGQVDNWNSIERNKVDYVARLLGPFFLILFTIVYIIATLAPYAPKYRLS